MSLRAILVAVLVVVAGQSPAGADEVKVAIGLSLSPYVIPDEGRGMEYDIVKEALAMEGHVMAPRFLPLGRVIKALETGEADAAMTQKPEASSTLSFSAVYIAYRNFVITLASRNLIINRFQDLADKSVVAFQRATTYLEPEFKAAVVDNPRYREEALQVVQPILLYLGRVDAVVADRNIFAWFAHSREAVAKVDVSQPVRFHPLFQPTEYRMAFRDAALRDSFDRGLTRLRRSGEYDRIVARYSPLMAEENR